MKASNYRLKGTSLFVVLTVCLCCFAGNVFAAGGYFTINLTQDEQFYPNGDTSTYFFTPSQTMKINFIIIECLSDKDNDTFEEQFQVSITSDAAGNIPISSRYPNRAAVSDLIDNFGSSNGTDFDTHMYLFDIPDTYVNSSNSYYLAMEVGGGPPVHTWGKAYIYYGDTTIEPSRIAHGRNRQHINVPNGHEFDNPGDTIITSFHLTQQSYCRFITLNCLDDAMIKDAATEVIEVAICSDGAGTNVLASAQITDNFYSHGDCDGHAYLFDIPDVDLAPNTYYLRTTAVSGTPIRTWAGADLYWSNWQNYTWKAIPSPPDVDKFTHGHPNSKSCWIATASNMLAGAGYGTGATAQAKADNIYTQMTAHYDISKGGWPRTALKWWLASANNTWPANPYVFVGIRGNWNVTAQAPYGNSNLPSIIGNKLRDGESLGVAFFWDGSSLGHVTAVWGDEGFTPDNYDVSPIDINPKKIIMVDSDCDSGGNLQKYTYERYPITTTSPVSYGWRFKEYGSWTPKPWVRCLSTLSKSDLDPLATYTRRQRIIGSYKVSKPGQVPDSTSLHYVVGAQTGNLILWDTDIDWDANTVPTIVDSPTQPKQLTVDWDLSDNPVPFGNQITITTELGIENGGGIWYSGVSFPGIYANIPDFGLDIIHNMIGSSPFDPNDEDIIGGFIYGTMTVSDGNGNDGEFSFVKEYDFDQSPEWHNVIISPHPEATEVYQISNLKFGHAYTLPDEPNDIWAFEEWLTDHYTGPYDLIPAGPPLEFELNWTGRGLLPYPPSNHYQGGDDPPARTFPADQNLQGLWHSDSAWGDFDNDGDLDLVICGKFPYLSPWTWITRTYENQAGTLVEKTQADLTGITNESGGGLAWGDYDGDGDLDLAMAGIKSDSTRIARIYENNGTGTLTEDANQVLVGVSNAAIAWGDYDNDGDLDLVVTGYDGTDSNSILYKNDPLGTLTPDQTTVLTGLRGGSADFADIDGDADLDLLLTGHDGTARRAIFYINDPVGTLTDDGAHGLTGVNLSDVAFGDYDNDGDMDIALTGDGNPKISRVYENDGNGAYTDIGAGLTDLYRSNVAWADYDNDGDLDLALCGYTGTGLQTKLYENTGSGFSYDHGFTGVREGSLSFADVNDTGDIGFFMTGADWSNTYSRLYSNEGGFANISPSAPNSLTSTPDNANGGILFEWSGAEDNETPYEGLYYVVRVGTEPGGNDILSGTYSTPLMGNRGQRTQLFLKVPKNTYYWSVKTIDSGLRASGWTIEEVCHHCRGSVDYDCDVDLIDFSIMANAWLASAGDDDYNEDCDISDSDDDLINEYDLEVLADNWLQNQ